MKEAQVLVLYQPTLQAIAYKMLGNMADAEDAVQEAFMKWLTIDTSKIENSKAYLVRVVTNSCLNILKSNKEKQFTSVNELEGIADPNNDKELHHFDLENQLSEAWKFLHRKLEPVEKTLFILREVFEVDYHDLQFIVDKKAENCRKIVSRAKDKLRSTELPKLPKLQINLPEMHLLESFKVACQKGNITQLVQDFTMEFLHKKR